MIHKTKVVSEEKKQISLEIMFEKGDTIETHMFRIPTSDMEYAVREAVLDVLLSLVPFIDSAIDEILKGDVE